MTKTFLVVYAKGRENFSGYAPDVQGCVSAGGTLDEMRANMKEALEFHLEGLAEDGDPMPEPQSVSVQFDREDFDGDISYFIVDKITINMPNHLRKQMRLTA